MNNLNPKINLQKILPKVNIIRRIVFEWSWSCSCDCIGYYLQVEKPMFKFFCQSLQVLRVDNKYQLEVPTKVKQMSQHSDYEDYKPEVCLSGSQAESFQQYRRRVQKYDQNSIEGKWSQQESLQYVLFMDYYSKIFASKEKRKTTRIFKTLSKFLVTRTPRQCRSHFQKIMTKFKNLKKVKAFYQEQLGLMVYQQNFDAVAKRIKAELPRSEDSEDKEVSMIRSSSTQTDPMNVKLSDLPRDELEKLISIVQEQHKAQMSYWMMPPFPHLGMYPYPPRIQ